MSLLLALVGAGGGGHTITLTGVPSAAGCGAVAVGGTVGLAGVPSGAGLGSVALNGSVALAGVASAAAPGAVAVGSVVALEGVPSGAGCGTVTITAPPPAASPGGGGPIRMRQPRPRIVHPHEIMLAGVPTASAVGFPAVWPRSRKRARRENEALELLEV